MKFLASLTALGPALLAVPALAQDHSGHVMPDPHAGHQMTPASAPVGNASAPAVPRDHAADAIHGSERMARAREALRMENGEFSGMAVVFDLAEYQVREDGDGYRWQNEAWFGGDEGRLVLRSEGEGTFGEPIEMLELQALYSRPIDPFWDLKLGLRHDVVPNPSRTHAVVGIEGDAPYWLDVEAMVFLSDKGEATARIEASYDLRITQPLVLRPSAEIDFSAQDMPDIGVGSGISTIEAGIRLRYEIVPEFAPYLGFEWQRKLGQSAAYARAAGHETGSSQLVAGVRFWF
jgi:copper resistance protein B